MSTDKTEIEITNPRRILAVSLTASAQHLSDVIQDLTGTNPSPASPPSFSEKEEAEETAATIAGITHPLQLTTPYYTASIPIWLDLIASPAEWSASFLSAEAREVLDVLGGVVVVFALPLSGGGTSPQSQEEEEEDTNDGAAAAAKELVRHVGRVVREGLGGWEWEGVGLVVGVGSSRTEKGDDDEQLDEWEDLCAEWGLEFVHVAKSDLGAGKKKKKKGEEGGSSKRNEFGERMGVARVLEALEANDWSGGGGDDDGEGDEVEDEDEDEKATKGKGGRGEADDDEFDPANLGFGFDREDFVGLRKAIWAGAEGGDGESSKGEADDKDEEVGEGDVQKLERMMLKLQAVKDASAGLPEEQRKRMAARAVGEVMKEL
ncbi:alpha and gamma adaptin binding protein p34-domain-containing protein [Chaetomidium leptoderma]|uniref:Alpha and gamma adaptin binding protein p34-domain-containing protein n=1 Tax=Chaetomidium leptoderma TaxID=669021 RepID=A0AAN6VJI5_9PEZI|nr:alpha and gamma adaptin binding protein p34-domain-containing protein [Chaetomidium leptoderma]